MTNALRQPKGFYRNAFALMIPIVLQNLITHTVALADTFMVGALGEQYLAAATMAATPMFLFMIFTFGVQSGAGILVAQYWGKGNTGAINRVLGVGLYFSVIFTFAGAIVVAIIPHQILGLVTADQTLVLIGAPYARIVGFSQALNAISMVYVSCQRSMENPRLGLIVLSISAVVNVFGNWILIFGKFGMPALGIVGAAIATLCARAIEVIIVTVYAYRNSRLPLKIALLLKPGMVIFRDFVKYSLPVLLNEALWGFGAMLTPVILGHMDGAQPILAAFTIAGNLERVFLVTAFACGNATAVIIGREIGAGRRERAESVAKTLLLLGLIFGLCTSALLLLVRFTALEGILSRFFDLSDDALSYATIMLTILACIMPLRNLGFTMGIGILRGGGDVKPLMYIDIGTLYLLAIPMAAITGLILKAGIAIVYSSFIVEDITKTALLYRRVRSRKWINDVTREQI
ncbi:MAG: MATE family efflux transporter [Oscillospiraceae bacterium]|jgi:putative MATE family efflux protein|nr:MATE family efflux transporter [Oscillospiraceae bacterium]